MEFELVADASVDITQAMSEMASKRHKVNESQVL